MILIKITVENVFSPTICLLCAIAQGRNDELEKELSREPAKVNSVNDAGLSPLHLAVDLDKVRGAVDSDIIRCF